MKSKEEQIKDRITKSLMQRDLDVICKDCITGSVGGFPDKKDCMMKLNCLRIYNDGIDNGKKEAIKIIPPQGNNDDFTNKMNYIINSFIEGNALPIANIIGCSIWNFNDKELCRGKECKDRKLCELIKQKEKEYYLKSINKL
jgi:hypothetical protein